MTLEEKKINFYGKNFPCDTSNDYYMDINVKQAIKNIKRRLSIMWEGVANFKEYTEKIIDEEIGEGLI